MQIYEKIDASVWEKKAISFSLRTAHTLWGKHNEDILAWLYENGLSTPYTKDRLLGWNTRVMERPCENWGLQQKSSGGDPPSKLLIPKGLTLPYIVNKKVLKLIVIDLDNPFGAYYTLPGSQPVGMRFGESIEKVILTDSPFAALLLHQAHKETVSVFVPHCGDHSQKNQTGGTKAEKERLIFFEQAADAYTLKLFTQKDNLSITTVFEACYEIVHEKNRFTSFDALMEYWDELK